MKIIPVTSSRIRLSRKILEICLLKDDCSIILIFVKDIAGKFFIVK